MRESDLQKEHNPHISELSTTKTNTSTHKHKEYKAWEVWEFKSIPKYQKVPKKATVFTM